MLSSETIKQAMKRAAKQQTFVLTQYGTLMSYEEYRQSMQEK